MNAFDRRLARAQELQSRWLRWAPFCGMTSIDDVLVDRIWEELQ